jgi:2-(1,2-epoxy-1,2-dihydrophenyl)acetyl-CoA isomerase
VSDYKTLQLALNYSEGYAVLTLNRPEERNAYTVEMGVELVAAFTRLRDDQAIRVIVLTGAGKIFCAGVDLDVLHRQAAESTIDKLRLGEEHFIRAFSSELFDFPKPVIAAINGPAVGIGVTMTLPLDFRIAASSATFSLPFARLGILPGLGSSYLLPRLVGSCAARELLFTARPISASRAASLGLVSHVVEDDYLLDEARDLAIDIASCPPEAIGALKQLINRGMETNSMADALTLEQYLSSELREKVAQKKIP